MSSRSHRSGPARRAIAGLATAIAVASAAPALAVPDPAAALSPLAPGVARLLAIDAAPAPPVPSGPGPVLTTAPPNPTNNAVPVFAWTGTDPLTRPVYSWQITDVNGAVVASHTGPETVTAPPRPLTDGTYAFAVWEHDAAGLTLSEATRHGFAVDTTPPPAPRITARPTFPTTVTTPAFGIDQMEPGATGGWHVVGAGGALVQGPGPVASASITLAALAPGSYVFEVRQVDPAGNVSPPASEPFAIVPPPVVPAAAAPARPRLVLPKMNTKRLKPRPGARVSSVRPVLKWTRGPRGTTLYNVQVFRVGSRTSENAATVRLTKLRSVFPRGRKVRMRGLKRGQCYVWRVWPYVGSRFTTKPLGVSNFCVAAPPKTKKR